MIERRKQTPSWVSRCTLLLAILMMAGSLAAQELGWPREIEVPEAKTIKGVERDVPALAGASRVENLGG